MASVTAATTATASAAVCFPSADRIVNAMDFPAKSYWSQMTCYTSGKKPEFSTNKNKFGVISNFERIAELMAKNPIPQPPTEESISKLLHVRFSPMQFLDTEHQSSIISVFKKIATDVIADPASYADKPCDAQPERLRFPTKDEIRSQIYQIARKYQLRDESCWLIEECAGLLAGKPLDRFPTQKAIEDFINNPMIADEDGLAERHEYSRYDHSKYAHDASTFFDVLAKEIRYKWEVSQKSSK